jgi:general secretion pathway protein F
VLARLADFMEERQRVAQRLKVAMIYPTVLTVVAIAVVSGLLGYVVPEVVKVFSQMNRELPALTRGLIAVSGFMRQWGVLMFAALHRAGFVVRAFFARPAPRLALHRLMLRLALLGTLIREADAGRFARTLAILLGSGLSMLEALHIAAKSVGNSSTAHRTRSRHRARARRRGPEPGPRPRHGFPPLLAHLVANGENSGELPKMLDSAADAHERSMQFKIAVLMGLAEPLLILLMGAVVLVIVLAILLPIFDMNRLV